MATATNTSASSSQILCECGDDHRTAGSRGCPVFEIINCLTKEIQEFLDVQHIVKFGEGGPMEKPLRHLIRSKLARTTGAFIKYEELVREHPEWCLDRGLSRLRKYFGDVAKGCSGHEEPSTLQKSLHDVIDLVHGDSQCLKNAKYRTLAFWTDCDSVILQYARNGAVPVSYTLDPEGYMSKVDNGFKRAVEAILPLSDTEKAAFQGLMNAAYKLWAESRRLLCDFKRPPKNAIL